MCHPRQMIAGRKANCFSVGKTGDVYLKGGTHDDFGQADFVFDDGIAFHQMTKYPVEQSDKNCSCGQNEHRDSGHQKFGQGSHCTESMKDSTFGTNKDKPKILDSYTDHKELDHLPLNREDNFENYFKNHKVNDLRVTATGESYTKSISQEYFHQASLNKKADHSSQNIVDKLEGSSGKVIQTSHNANGKQENNVWDSQTAHRSMVEINSEQYPVNSRASKSTEQLRKSDGSNERHSNIFCQPSPTMPECSPMKKDCHITINALIQEARDLKHTASRLKVNIVFEFLIILSFIRYLS